MLSNISSKYNKNRICICNSSGLKTFLFVFIYRSGCDLYSSIRNTFCLYRNGRNLSQILSKHDAFVCTSSLDRALTDIYFHFLVPSQPLFMLSSCVFIPPVSTCFCLGSQLPCVFTSSSFLVAIFATLLHYIICNIMSNFILKKQFIYLF